MIEEISMVQEITNAIDELVEMGLEKRNVVLFLSRGVYLALRDEVAEWPAHINAPDWPQFILATRCGSSAMIFDGIKCLPTVGGEGYLVVAKEFVEKKFF